MAIGLNAATFIVGHPYALSPLYLVTWSLRRAGRTATPHGAASFIFLRDLAAQSYHEKFHPWQIPNDSFRKLLRSRPRPFSPITGA
jgi:hypothetical protein